MYIIQRNWDSEALDDKFKVTADPYREGNSALSWDFHTEISQWETHSEPQGHTP